MKYRDAVWRARKLLTPGPLLERVQVWIQRLEDDGHPEPLALRKFDGGLLIEWPPTLTNHVELAIQDDGKSVLRIHSAGALVSDFTQDPSKGITHRGENWYTARALAGGARCAVSEETEFSPVCAELAAMESVMRILEPLTSDERQRVIAWVEEKFSCDANNLFVARMERLVKEMKADQAAQKAASGLPGKAGAGNGGAR